MAGHDRAVPFNGSQTTYGCKWTTYLNGCDSGIWDCGPILPSIVWFSCKPGFKQTDGDRCVPVNEVTPHELTCTNNNKGIAPGFGDPVALLDGALEEDALDYASPDGRLQVKRHYSSLPGVADTILQSAPRGSVGGWRFDAGPEIHFDGNANLSLHLPEGTAYNFALSGNAVVANPSVLPQTRYSIAYAGTPPANWTTIFSASSQWRMTDARTGDVWLLQTFKIPPAGTVFNVARAIGKTLPDGFQLAYAYDASGSLASITDSNGRKLGFAWNYFSYPTAGGPVVYVKVPVSIRSIALPGGGKLTYSYDVGLDANGNLLNANVQKLTGAVQYDAVGIIAETTTYQYENLPYPRYLTGITDGRGIRYATIAYDGLGRVVSTNQTGAETYSIAYGTPAASDPNILTRTATNPLGKQAVYSWSHPISGAGSTFAAVAGQASASCAASNTTYAYANGFVTSAIDAEGRVTAYVNDARGRHTSITRGSGTPQAATTTMTWDPVFDIPATIVEPGVTTTRTIVNGLVTSVSKKDTTTQTLPYSTNGQTRTWIYAYTGRLLTVATDPSGATVRYTYDANGNVKTVVNESGWTTTVNAVDGDGRPVSVTDPNGMVILLAYDYRGRLKTISADAGNVPSVTTLVYDAAGDVTRVTEPNGAFQAFTWDGARRLAQVANAAGETTAYTRDAMGNATGVTVKNASAATVYTKTQVFDELGRLIKSLGAVAANSAYTFAYDRTDNLVSVKDPRSYAFSYGFDALNRLVKETDEGGASVNLTRNGIDAVTGYADPRNLATTYIRNGFGEVIQEVSPDRGTTTYVRDARGLATRRTDARGIVSNYSYDAAGRLTAIAYPANPAHYAALTWDVLSGPNFGIGRLTGISDESGISWLVYDRQGRVSTDYRTNYPATSAVSTAYSYDASGNVTGMTYPSGRVVFYTRDVQGRATAIYTRPNAGGAQTTVVYNVAWMPFGGVKGFTFGLNNLAASFGYDTDYRVNAVKVGIGTLDRTLSWTGETLDKIANNLDATQTETLTYTPAHRLASASGKYGSLTWLYDGVGNRTSQTAGTVASAYAYPANSNRLASITPAGGAARAFSYDASGNTLADTRAGALGLTFVYDENGRLSKTFQTNNPLEGATYAYDARWRLASRTATHAVAPLSATIGYIHDTAGHVIAETDAAGATRREYIWLGDLPVAVVDNVAAAPVVYAVHTDHLGRPVVITREDSSWAWSALYKPFGETQALYATNTTMDIRFPGQWFQLESGLAYNWHRHYDATTGRYLQPDPMGVINPKNDGPSIYAYARSNVFSRTDYSGLLSVPGGGGVGALGTDATDSACTSNNPMGLAPDRTPVDPARLPTLRECIIAILCWFGGEQIGSTPPPPPPPPIKIIIKP